MTRLKQRNGKTTLMKVDILLVFVFDKTIKSCVGGGEQESMCKPYVSI